MPMNIEDYRYITAITDTGGFTAAANVLFVSQPSLSQRVKHIERVYGITIFNRDSKKITLTQEGECFVRHARMLLACEENIRKEILDMRGVDDWPLRVGIPQLIHTHFFGQLLHHIHEHGSGLQLEIIEGSSSQLQQMLSIGAIDVTFCFLPINYSTLAYKFIYEDRFVLIPAAGSSLEEKIQKAEIQPGGYVDSKLLEGEIFAVGMPGTRSSNFLESVMKEHNIDIHITHRCKNFSALYKIAMSGNASAILNESIVKENQEVTSYYQLKDTNNDTLFAVVAWRKDIYQRKAIKELLQFVQEIQ